MQNSFKTFVTLQNGGSNFYPQYVFNRNDFIQGMSEIGYELIDDWRSRFDSCVIPFNRDKSVYEYTGLYFRLRARS